jgi:hypothetical protein
VQGAEATRAPSWREGGCTPPTSCPSAVGRSGAATAARRSGSRAAGR